MKFPYYYVRGMKKIHCHIQIPEFFQKPKLSTFMDYLLSQRAESPFNTCHHFISNFNQKHENLDTTGKVIIFHRQSFADVFQNKYP